MEFIKHKIKKKKLTFNNRDNISLLVNLLNKREKILKLINYINNNKNKCFNEFYLNKLKYLVLFLFLQDYRYNI